MLWAIQIPFHRCHLSAFFWSSFSLPSTAFRVFLSTVVGKKPAPKQADSEGDGAALTPVQASVLPQAHFNTAIVSMVVVVHEIRTIPEE